MLCVRPVSGREHHAVTSKPGGYVQEQISYKERLAALSEDVEQVDWDAFVVKGTQQELEKSYFRLTSAPDPSTVRPEPVLRRAYQRLVSLLREGSENYFYALDQFKGMRQDCTVQHLKNDLTVSILPTAAAGGHMLIPLTVLLLFWSKQQPDSLLQCSIATRYWCMRHTLGLRWSMGTMRSTTNARRSWTSCTGTAVCLDAVKNSWPIAYCTRLPMQSKGRALPCCTPSALP
jgi:hypothetical protein